jgi:hypothetical protein
MELKWEYSIGIFLTKIDKEYTVSMKKMIFYLIFLSSGYGVFSQTSDNQYKKPLKEVVEEIENRYQVRIRDPENLIQDQWITYADWRFRPDVVETLENIFSSVSITVIQEGQDKYKLKRYEYYRMPVQEGKEILDHLASGYHDVTTWEKRKSELRACLRKALRLNPMPACPHSKPIVTAMRKMNGYGVQNMAIETLPGLYVCGSLYQPLEVKDKIPVILSPNGHFQKGRYNKDIQIRCAMLAKMGAMVFTYDLFAYGESLLQFDAQDHKRSLAMTIQALNSIRILDYLLSLPVVDTSRVGITGASGGGSQTMLITALDDRIKVSVPVAMLSCYFYGGCPCESGMPVHLCGGGTNNVEMAAMAAPRPQLVISDGGDWTAHVPEIEYPYLQQIYSFYGKADMVSNIHLANEQHDYGPSKRRAMYRFMAEHLNLDIEKIKDSSGKIDESTVSIEESSAMYVFGKEGELLPENAIKGFYNLVSVFEHRPKPINK